jgi:hypothetical protein
MTILSVVIETFNAESPIKNKLDAVLNKLKQQSYPQEYLEILIAIGKNQKIMIDHIEAKHPHCKLVIVEDSTYYNLKYFGLKAAKGDIVALLDSDCVPEIDWAKAIVEEFANGADFTAGKTRYSQESIFSKLFNIFSFGDIQNDKNGNANRFAENNVAFKREIVDQFKYDDRRKRYYGGSLISSELKAQNFKFTYNPKQHVVHFDVGILSQTEMRFRSGHDVVMVSSNDVTGVVPETKYLRYGIIFPFISATRRIVSDFKILLYNHKDLDINIFTIPIFFSGCILVRLFEIIPGLITIVSPNYLKQKFNW